MNGGMNLNEAKDTRITDSIKNKEWGITCAKLDWVIAVIEHLCSSTSIIDER